MTTQEVAKFLIEREISGAPVVDELGRSLASFLSPTSRALPPSRPMGSAVNRPATSTGQTRMSPRPSKTSGNATWSSTVSRSVT